MRELERDLPTHLMDPSEHSPALAIVGAGRVGGALSTAARRAGLDVRTAGRADALDACNEAEVALLCVPDAAIPAALDRILAAIPPLRLVGHVSGATGLDALEPALEGGAATFSAHPLQTVPDPDADLTAAPCAIAGSDPAAVDYATELALRLGMRPFRVPEQNRAAYHAAAAIASNFLVALGESAADLLARAGVEEAEARELLAPLLLRSAANWAERGGEALTGPIARGDAETVARHREALAEVAPDLRELYDALAERTRAVARSRTEAG